MGARPSPPVRVVGDVHTPSSNLNNLNLNNLNNNHSETPGRRGGDGH